MTRVKIGEFRDRANEPIRRAAGGETVVILNRNREVDREDRASTADKGAATRRVLQLIAELEAEGVL